MTAVLGRCRSSRWPTRCTRIACDNSRRWVSTRGRLRRTPGCTRRLLLSRARTCGAPLLGLPCLLLPAPLPGPVSFPVAPCTPCRIQWCPHWQLDPRQVTHRPRLVLQARLPCPRPRRWERLPPPPPPRMPRRWPLPRQPRVSCRLQLQVSRTVSRLPWYLPAMSRWALRPLPPRLQDHLSRRPRCWRLSKPR